MNERIRELAEQASHQSPDGYAVTIPYSKDFAEKFAELIVRECARVYWNIDDGEIHGEYVKALKEHFGIEK
jgi:hypothetical protein